MAKRSINTESERILKQWEGFIPFAYDDADKPSNRRRIKKGDHVAGTLTIGYGHTGPDVVPGMVITEEQALKLLRRDIDPCEDAVSRLVKVPLEDNQFGALVLFAFNAGVGAFKGSTLLKKLNTGDYASVPSELAKWNKTTINGKKVVSNGLKNRRAAEAGLWAKGSFVQSSGTPALPDTPPLVSKDAAAVGTAIVSGGALQFVPKDGPIAYALAAILVGAALFGLYLYIQKRRGN